MTAPVVQLFVHPRAGRRARRRIAGLRSAFEQEGATVIVTASIRDRLEIDARSTHICAVGGDGTLRHVVDALYRSTRSVPISVYPAGTVNLLARECGYPRAPRAFVRRVLDGGARSQHHMALVGRTPLLTCASVGPDSFVVEAVSPALKNRLGRAAYVVAFCKLLIRWRRVPMIVSCGEDHIECEAVYIAKGRFFAGRWAFAPHARTTDPLLHVVVLKRAARRHFLRFAWALWRGCPVERLDGVRCFSCARLTISGDKSAPLQADGDVVACLPASVSLAPDTLEFS